MEGEAVGTWIFMYVTVTSQSGGLYVAVGIAYYPSK